MPAHVRLRARENQHGSPRPVDRGVELDLGPAQLGVHPVDDPHDRSPGPVVDQLVGVEARHKFVGHGRQQMPDGIVGRDSPRRSNHPDRSPAPRAPSPASCGSPPARLARVPHRATRSYPPRLRRVHHHGRPLPVSGRQAVDRVPARRGQPGDGVRVDGKVEPVVAHCAADITGVHALEDARRASRTQTPGRSRGLPGPSR